MPRRAKETPREGPGLFDAAASRPAPPAGEGRAAQSPSPDANAGQDEPRPTRTRGPEPEPEEDAALSVSELTEEIKGSLGAFGRVRVRGELSGLKRAASGHVYFDLKDEGARLSCVIWRGSVSRALRFEPEDGQELVAHGRLDVYPPRGSYNLIVERLEPIGLGALLIKLELLKRELAELGRFDRHRPLPAMPRTVGVVTSRDGAALRDFLRTRSLRFPGYPVRLCHTAVQGPGAAASIADAIARLDRSGVDVIVVCRGGGSLEDLWAFNERAVADAIWNASVPVVSGVGHESDTTLCDLVADHRAHTPTDAAQTVLPDRAELAAGLERWTNFLFQAADRTVSERARRLGDLARRRVLVRPDWILGDRVAHLDAKRRRLIGALESALRGRTNTLTRLLARIERRSPGARLREFEGRLVHAASRLAAGGQRAVDTRTADLRGLARALEGVSPLKVLGRGYSVTRRAGETRPLASVKGLAAREEIDVRLHDGTIRAAVVSTEPGDPAAKEKRS